MNNQWTTTNIPDLTGKVVIVTGANSGTGFETAKELARKGATTIMACRSMDKAASALAKVKAEIADAPVEIMQLDLASLASVHQFAADFQAKYDRLDVLVNNAGIMMVPYGQTVDGFERQLGTNHLGHFALTGALLPLLQKTADSRVVNVSSNAHHSGEMEFSDLMFDGGNEYTPMKAYGRSKLANILFTYELQRRYDERDIQAKALVAHPGISATNLANHMMDRWYIKPFRPLFGLMVQSAAMGALPIIRAAVDPQASGGQYYGPDGKGERSGYPVVVQSNAASHQEADARQLWEVSEQLTGISYLS